MEKWHQRYDYMNFRNQSLMPMKNMVYGLPHIKLQGNYEKNVVYPNMQENYSSMTYL